MQRFFCFAAGFIALSCVSNLHSAELAQLAEGDKAPAFSALDDSGNIWSSDSIIGEQVVVVYFYEADMSGRCTKQARMFNERLDELRRRGATVIGVSGDTVENHKLFKKTYGLKFTLLSDPDGIVASKFGVPTRKGGEITRVIKGKYHRLARGVTPERWTFVIDKSGKVVHKEVRVNAAVAHRSIIQLLDTMD